MIGGQGFFVVVQVDVGAELGEARRFTGLLPAEVPCCEATGEDGPPEQNRQVQELGPVAGADVLAHRTRQLVHYFDRMVEL